MSCPYSTSQRKADSGNWLSTLCLPTFWVPCILAVHMFLFFFSLQPRPLFDKGLRYLTGHVAHSGKVFGPLRYPDGTARVKDIEGVVAFEHKVVGGEDETEVNTTLRFCFEKAEQFRLHLDIGIIQVVPAVFVFGDAVHFAVRDPGGVEYVLKVIHSLEKHGDTL